MSATLWAFPKFQPLDNNGKIIPGFKLYTYAAGTTTPLATYTDASGSVQNTNPVIGDASGRADVWYGNSAYKLVLKTSADVQIWAEDNIAPKNAIVSNPTGVQTIDDYALNVTAGINGPVGQDSPNVGDFTEVDSQSYKLNGAALQVSDLAGTALASQMPDLTFDLFLPIDGGGVTPTTGSKGYIGPFDFGFTIQAWTMLSDQVGSAVIDVKKGTYVDFPTAPSSIAGSDKPTISSDRKNQSTALTGWTTTVAAGDLLEFTIDSITSITRLSLTLKCSRDY